MPLTNKERERYARHLVLKEVGEAGQEKLLNSKVLIIGTGGLGSPASAYLTAAGIGTLGLVDFDKVDLSNLQRQLIHMTKNIGKPKLTSAKETLNNINPDMNIITYNEYLDHKNISDIINDQDYDFVLDCTDNFQSKFLINDTCVAFKKPFSHGGVIRFSGQTMTYVPGKGPCYRCVFVNPPLDGTIKTSKQVGIMGTSPGVIGTIQATEAIKYILGIGNLLTGYLLTYDALKMEFRKIKVSKRKDCKACG